MGADSTTRTLQPSSRGFGGQSWRATPWCRWPTGHPPLLAEANRAAPRRCGETPHPRLCEPASWPPFAGAPAPWRWPPLATNIETPLNSPPSGTLGVFSLHEQLSHCGCGRATWHRIDAGLATKARGPERVVLADIRLVDHPDAALSTFVQCDASDKTAMADLVDQAQPRRNVHAGRHAFCEGRGFPLQAWGLNMDPLLHALELARRPRGEGVLAELDCGVWT